MHSITKSRQAQVLVWLCWFLFLLVLWQAEVSPSRDLTEPLLGCRGRS